ncbi:MAG TPA: TIGR01777 family oxidoreductase [Chryseolinea sp.]
MNQKILITGASGLIGTRLTGLLQRNGYEVANLARSASSEKPKTFLWDPDKDKIDSTSIRFPDSIIHLAGESIGGKPWTKDRKNRILKSRTHSTWLLYDELKKGNHNVKTFISASGISYYGVEERHDMFHENDKQGDGFLAEVVHQWEACVDQIATLGIRVVKLRTGVVLSENGGAMKELMKPLRFYVGAPLGKGTQVLSWIHLDDLCRIYIKAVDDEAMEGVYNAVAPNPVTNSVFTQQLAEAMGKPIILPPIPSFVLKLLLGEMSDLVLRGTKVSSQKIQATGFRFEFENLNDALNDLLAK